MTGRTITDVIQDTSKDMVLRDMSERQGEQIGETREALTWDVLRAGTSVVYGGSATHAAPSARYQHNKDPHLQRAQAT